MDDHELQRRFTRHRHSQLRAQALAFARLINSTCPEGVEKRVAVDRLEESVLWAGAALAGLAACAPGGEEIP